LLTIVTLGVYRFWGKTRVRRYIWSRMEFQDDRFEYTGTGLELFFGFLIALAMLGLPIGGLYAWMLSDPPKPGDAGKFGAQIGLIFLFAFFLFYMTGVGVYAAQRFRSSRTRWRGIGGGLEGSAWVYGLLELGLSLLNGLSAGWTKPWADATKMQYRLGRTFVGSTQLQSRIPIAGLYGPFTLMWCMVAVVVVAAYAVMIYYIVTVAMRNGGPPKLDPGDFFAIAVGVYIFVGVVVLIYYVTVQWYWAALLRNIARGTLIGGAALGFDATMGKLIRLNLLNGLMLIVSFGLLYPIVLHRKARFLADNFVLYGRIDESAMRQYDGAAPRFGEGIVEFLGIGGL
jgi:uncharacterized membrane protein YjgN (DUF898 family)